jgi:hypothetical protein
VAKFRSTNLARNSAESQLPGPLKIPSAAPVDRLFTPVLGHGFSLPAELSSLSVDSDSVTTIQDMAMKNSPPTQGVHSENADEKLRFRQT